MKRRLSAREIILIGILLVLVLVGSYLLLFYRPMAAERDRLESEKAACEEQLQPALARIEEKRRMEQELEVIFASSKAPVSLAPYDNQKPVMVELNSILQSTREYSLSFSTVEAGEEDKLVRRRISLSFTSGSYEAAREVLNRLNNSIYRCMLDDISVSLGEQGGATSVSTTLVYFEY